VSQLSAVRTSLPAPQALYVLGHALGSDVRALPMVAAQSAHETAHWTAMWRWNFGNVTAGPGDDYQVLPGLPTMHFKTYDTAEQGARDYIQWLRSRGVLDYALRGDLDGYVDHLKAHGYLGFIGRVAPDGHIISDDDYDSYRRSIAGMIGSFEHLLPEPLRGTVVLLRGSTAQRKAVTVAAVLGVGIALAISGSSGWEPRSRRSHRR
jgi:hypothetical protein